MTVDDDPKVSQFDESLQVFKQVANDSRLQNIPLVLLLNKKDLMLSRLDDYPLAKYCPDYRGRDGDYQDAIDYFKRRFMEVNEQKDRACYIYITNGTDSV